MGHEMNTTMTDVVMHPPSARMRALSRLVAVVLVCAAGFFVSTAMIGAWGWTHPIPYWDMWDGHLSFWFELQDGNTAIWWELSNEHHLLLLKAIFWVDLVAFSGSAAFLIFVNLLLLFALAAALIILLNRHVSESLTDIRCTAGRVIISSTVVCILLAWMQGEDLTIGYHSQWILITMLPIVTFLFLALAKHSSRAQGTFFVLSVVTAALTPWAAASGLVAPFIAAALAWMLGFTFRRVITFLVVGVASTIIYGIGHPLLDSSSDGGLLSNVTSMPVDTVRFWLLYLGGPWSRVTDNQWIAGIAGAVFVVVVIYYSVQQIRSRERQALGLAAISFPVFMLLMALVTAMGRISFGIEQVTALRYLTPMLSAWACLLILAAPALIRWMRQGAALAFLPPLIVVLLLLPEQAKALEPPRDALQRKDVATLAIAMGAIDPSAITPVYPISPDRPVALGERARAEGVGVFGSPPYATLLDRLGKSGSFSPATKCLGWVDSRTPIDGSNLDRIDGWLIAEGQFINNGLFEVLDSAGKIAGFIDVGSRRDDVLDEFPNSGGFSGYTGYVNRSIPSSEVYVASTDFRCTNPLTPAIP